jgi:hypothetical protein
MSDPRYTVIAVATAEVGTKDPIKYWLDALGSVPEHNLAWCGLFALWCLRQAELTDWTWAIGKGFLYRLHRTSDPLVGDLVYFDKPYQHHAILRDIIDGDTVPLIQGNYGVPGHVAESTCSLSAKNPVFFSIQSLIDEANP